jgi:acetyl-CoA acetyltransferase
MQKTLLAGVCLLALAAALPDQASARRKSDCANPTEVSALQTAAVQQELMDAALGCGEESMHHFNAFQTAYGPELRRSDKTLLTLFKRVYGPVRGDAAYNLFKTNMASKAEIRRVHQLHDFCASAELVFAAALAASKPSLTEFVAGVQIKDSDESPIGRCDIQVAVSLQGALVAVNVVPKPNPLRVAIAAPDPLRTPASLTVYTPPPVAAPAPQPPVQKAEEKPKEEKKGLLSGLFH